MAEDCAPRIEGHSRRSADRRLHIGTVEANADICQSIDIRCGERRVATARQVVVSKLIAHDEKDVADGHVSALRLAVPGQQRAAQPAKSQVRQKTKETDHDDAGEDTLGAEGLLSFENHIADADASSYHLGSDDDDERDSPGKPYTREDLRQTAREHDGGEDLGRSGSQGLRGAKEIWIDAAHACISVEDHRERRGEADDEDLGSVAD